MPWTRAKAGGPPRRIEPDGGIDRQLWPKDASSDALLPTVEAPGHCGHRIDALTDNIHAYLGKGRCPAV
jgi:hypothetical protein